MNDNTNRFKAAIAMLCAEYDYTMSKPKMTLWMAKLSKYDSSQIEAAIDTLLETRVSAYFPRLPEIIHAIDGDPASIARSRFNNVLEAAKQNTPESWAAVDDVSNGVVKRMGGREVFADVKKREQTFLSKDFVSMYLSASVSSRIAQTAKRIREERSLDAQRLPTGNKNYRIEKCQKLL
jgi:hypothetical protein